LAAALFDLALDAEAAPFPFDVNDGTAETEVRVKF
jgi:hypothetical protein